MTQGSRKKAVAKKDTPPKSAETLQRKMGYAFADPGLLQQALIHPSYSPETEAEKAAGNNQRFEFLGDSVLGLILSEKLHSLFPEAREGELSRYRAALARGRFLSELARTLRLGEHLFISKGERESGGRERENLLEDALEALIGAIYLDSDFPTVRRVVLKWYGPLQKRLEELKTRDNPKGHLQEAIQTDHSIDDLRYRVIAEAGPSHDRQFEVEVLLKGKPLGRGKGSSKKEAETRAAENAIRCLDARP